ncbi:efflux RND transporter periplasmic adaptor subunit [Thiohalomonas denitrificans]|uniref:RND family efflux transporter, MFP subunit n=1 Tax=Thiohalomonas denitrificans TaxID=415747 RepID=A0A1G5PZR5_9GAMM|nr:efflux RND transporter periplasmic adaptor subunit [Thiohalomonas denitrificans]SCZ54720.1 RND family efflux transporter, MFP subunit [Thiohalomonas denitrificans]
MRIQPLIAAAALLLAPSTIAGAAQLPFAVAEARVETIEREQVFDAVLEAVHRATVSAQTSGRILEVNFDIDDYVSKDEVIVRLRDQQQRAALDAAEATLAEAQASFRRMQDLLNRDLVSRSEFDKAEAALLSARAAVEQARDQLENTRVRAPFSGIVVERHVEPGETASPGQPLMTGLSLEQLRATANVSQPYVDQVRQRGQARITLPAAVGEEQQVVEAKSITVSPYADSESHTFRVRVDLPDGRHGSYPGMFAKVAFTVGEWERLLVPSQAVVHRSEVTAVYVVRDGSISFRQIRVGRDHDGMTEVLAGLSDGEKVALDPIRAGVYLKDVRAGEAQ